jgi:hypothetical protein
LGRGTGTSLAPGSDPEALPGTTDGIADGNDGFFLADHPIADHPFHTQKFLAFACEHLVYRASGPARNDGGNVVVGNLFVEHSVIGDRVIGPAQVSVALHALQSHRRGIEFFLHLLGIREMIFLELPDPRQLRGFSL